MAEVVCWLSEGECQEREWGGGFRVLLTSGSLCAEIKNKQIIKAVHRTTCTGRLEPPSPIIDRLEASPIFSSDLDIFVSVRGHLAPRPILKTLLNK